MQIDLDSKLGSPGLLLPLPKRLAGRWSSRKRVAVVVPLGALRAAQRQALQGWRLEDVAWVALGLGALAVVITSFLVC